MRRKSRILSLLLASMLCLTSVSTVHADELSDAKEKQEELEEQKKAAEKTKSELTDKLNSIAAEMQETQTKLEEKEVEIIEKQDQLDLARIDEADQYANMKLRIRFMYENGNTEMLQMLMESKSIGDFLNKAEYIQQVSDYDRVKLQEFQDTVKEIEEAEEQLKKEEEELNALQDELIGKKGEVEELIAEANAELSNIDNDMSANTKTINRLIAEAEARKQQQITSGGGSAGASQIIGNGVLAWPTTSQRVTSTYGWRAVPVAGATAYHDAIDIGAPIGTPVYAAAAGTVITAKSGYNGGRGNYIMIDHGNGLVTRYQHLNSIYVSAGQSVSKGQNIAAVGNTGASSGPHLDYAIYVNGSTVDPLSYY